MCTQKNVIFSTYLIKLPYLFIYFLSFCFLPFSPLLPQPYITFPVAKTMTNLPKLVTANLDQTKGGEKSRSTLHSPSSNRPPLSSNDSKSRDRIKFKGVIDKFMGNFNGPFQVPFLDACTCLMISKALLYLYFKQNFYLIVIQLKITR